MLNKGRDKELNKHPIRVLFFLKKMALFLDVNSNNYDYQRIHYGENNFFCGF